MNSEIRDCSNSPIKKALPRELHEYWFKCPHCDWESNYTNNEYTYLGMRMIGIDLSENKKDAEKAFFDMDGKKKRCKKCGGEVSF